MLIGRDGYALAERQMRRSERRGRQEPKTYSEYTKDVVILTLHPDAVCFGRPETGIRLMEQMRSAGFHVEMTAGWQQRYAVIDQRVVWYGNMNLLSKDDAEDCIIRITDEETAAELLEISFHKGGNNAAFALPLAGDENQGNTAPFS